MNKEELKEKVDILTKKVGELWKESFKHEDGWNWYNNHPTLKELIELRREYKLIQNYELRNMDDLDKECKVALKTFVEWCKDGYVTSYDGSGYYATKDKVSNININPDDVRANKYRKDFSYICWYNK